MKMQFKKLVAAGTLAGIMIGATVGFAALSDYPAPFVTAAGVQSFVVVGAVAQPQDVVGSIDLAARLGGEVTTDVAVSGAVGGFSVSGEGKALDTATTRIFLGDDMGKSGLRTTLTRDDMPTILAKGSFADSDGTHKYDQYIDMTPGTSTDTKADVKFGKPGSSSSADPAYVIGEQSTGRLTTSPSTTDFLYKVRVVFDVAVNDTNSVGKTLQLFGNEYTISADTDFDSATQKLVLFGGADIQTLTGGQEITTTVSGTSYTIKLLGVQSDGKAVLQVGGSSETVTKGSTSSNFGDLKIYVKDTASLSTTDQTQNVATLLIGADKLTLQDSAKVKKGNNDDSVDGTYVDLGIGSDEKLSTITVYFAARSSTNDFITAGSDTFLNQVFNTFGVKFAGVTPSLMGPSDDHLVLKNSGDNNLQATFTDYNGYTATVNYGYKASSAAQDLVLNDSSGNGIIVKEGATVARDQYIILDAGGYPHMFQVSNVDLSGSASSSIDLKDVFSGATTKITTGSDNYEEAVIDGQTYYFQNVTSSTFNVTWGTSASIGARGKFTTVWPKLKTQHGAILAFVGPAVNVPLTTTVVAFKNSTLLELPSGAVNITVQSLDSGSGANWTLTGINREDATTSSATAYTDATDETSVIFQLGRTTTGGLYYKATRVAASNSINLELVGAANASTVIGNATVVLVEEKDDSGVEGGLAFAGATGTSGSNYLAGVAAPTMSGGTYSAQTWGSNSNKASYLNIWGTLVARDTSTSAQPFVDVYYPDTQRIASLSVLGSGATVTATTGASGSVVKSATPIKTALGKLDTEVTSADKTNKNLILVGGPVVNTLVAELAAASKTKDTAWYRSQGAGTALIDLVADAFATGKSALVVAGYEAPDTRAATSALQNFDAYTWASDRVVLKNGVISSATA
jgi:hypothetical protein